MESFTSFPKLISHLLGFTFEEAMGMAEMDFESMLENGDDYEEESFVETLMDEAMKLENFPVVYKEEEYCYNCSTYSMHAEAGCWVCSNCGYEKCG
jgi:hypothetical protein